MWTYLKTEIEGYWTYPVRRTLFRRRLVVDNRKWGMLGDYEHFARHDHWYNNFTREFDTITTRLKTFEDIVDEGRCVYDPVTEQYFCPEGVEVL